MSRPTRKGKAEQLPLYSTRTAGLETFVIHTFGYLVDAYVGTADTAADAALLASRRLGVPCEAQPDGGDEHLLTARYSEHGPSSAVGIIAPAGRYSPFEGGR